MLQYKVEISTCDKTVTADDSVVAGQGTAAKNALEHGMDIWVWNADRTSGEFVQFKCACYAEITVTEVPDEPVEDANCNYVCDCGGDNP